VRMIAVVVAASVALVTPTSYLQSQQHPDGGWGSAQMTAWSALGLRAANADTGDALAYLVAHEAELQQPTEVALAALAEAALGRDPQSLLARFPAKPAAVNAAVWELLALRQSGRPAPPALVSYVRGSQARNGGFPWARGTAPDSNDTAAAIQALRAAGVGGAPVRRAVVALRTFQNRDGGFGLTKGRESDAQSTAWAIQALISAGQKPGKPPFRYLSRLRRADGSYRYSVRYGTTPVWVTAQVVPALAGKPFPLR
jgi:Prenyltransferase and squalene oxidase repeat